MFSLFDPSLPVCISGLEKKLVPGLEGLKKIINKLLTKQGVGLSQLLLKVDLIKSNVVVM